MDYRTPKCAHNERGMCIHCLVKRGRKERNDPKMQEQKMTPATIKCTHPAHMKCLKCLPSIIKQSPCTHPDYQQCKNCQNFIMYESFQEYLYTLAQNCKHKKPCSKCVPPLNRKHFSIDKSCRNHLPYPQAQCDSCMAPTITIKKQSYTHVSKVRILTNAIYKISETKCVGVLLGMQNKGVIQVYDIYFPEDQDQKSGYISYEMLGKYNKIWNYMNLKQVGIIYSSSHLTSMSLMISSLFQEHFSTISNENQISKFITMRLQFSNEDNNFQPHFECFMVSDQFQAFHRNNLIYEKNENKVNYFDLITAKHQDKLSQLPTFLREGVQTDRIYFKEIITWISTVYDEQAAFVLNNSSPESIYPYFKIESQSLDHFNILLNLDPRDPLQKYRNIQFLLHLTKLIGIENVIIFLNDFFLDNPDLFLKEKLKMCEKIDRNNNKNSFSYSNSRSNTKRHQNQYQDYDEDSFY